MDKGIQTRKEIAMGVSGAKKEVAGKTNTKKVVKNSVGGKSSKKGCK